MNRTEARQMAAALKAAGADDPRVLHPDMDWTPPSPEFDADPGWRVEMWIVSAKAGNRTLTVVRDFSLDSAATIVREAAGKATKRDGAAFARIAAARAMDRD